MRSNAVAYLAPGEPAVRRRGRPRKYGRKVALKSLFAELDRFVPATSPVYGVRFKIEVTFKHAVHSVGTWCYHFWMAGMKPLKRRSGNQYMHMETEHYRQAVRRKLGAYACFVQMGVIAQGLLQMLAILYPDTVWRRFGSCLRTIRPGGGPV